MFGRLENWVRGMLGWEHNPSTVNERAVELANQGNYAEALVELDRAIAAAPYFAQAWLNRASCRVHLEDYAAAVDDCNRALELEPGLMPAYYGRGIALAALQRYAEAHADYSRALAIDARDVNLYLYRAIAAERLNQPDQAIADLNMLLAQDPQNAVATLRRATILLSLEKNDLALADFERVTELEPANALAWCYVGTCRYLRAEPELAIGALTQSLNLQADDMLARNNRGAALFLLGRYAEAQADFVRTIELHPEFASAKKNLAWLRATCPDSQLRNGREAVELARQALDMTHSDQPAWLEVLAAAHAESGDFDSASDWQRQTIEQLQAADDSPTTQRLRMYQSRQPFRHSCEPGQPMELMPGARAVTAKEQRETINRA
jgi:tetratricopeptide (TPR) repeat protein